LTQVFIKSFLDNSNNMQTNLTLLYFFFRVIRVRIIFLNINEITSFFWFKSFHRSPFWFWDQMQTIRYPTDFCLPLWRDSLSFAFIDSHSACSGKFMLVNALWFCKYSSLCLMCIF
jgi:hypothetical protein